MATKDGVDTSKLPKVLDMSPENITANVIAMNANCPDERTKFIMKNLVTHLHDFVRETSITTEEWMGALLFLTATGKKCTDLRQEFILLSDALGVSTLVDSLNNAKPPGASEATVMGPFFTADALDFQNGESIASEGKGNYMYVSGKVTDTKGNPIPNCVIETWETDGHGKYDNQYEERGGPDCRGRLHTTEDGSYWFRAVVPVSYPIPDDGPVGTFFKTLGRHTYRPAHLHMMLEAPGFEKLITALYWADDPYVTSDAVFGVKNSLIIRTTTETDVAVTRARGFKDAKTHEVLKQDFVLATVEEATEARKKTMPHLNH
ncbi:intradiol ring-cleavage dioxygenase [Mycena metata]|jgi:protocatechuate 3,4-dioxygenase beta subunit|uniref:Intradiol ring-cleavage dioxygenase n=1 Tax=Mycena metata TaxID=1033252 RepID=A0AAD7K7A1_9AGAR|nr:intradiol ring-cleavage dioxygenase [Mycena metata]